MPSSSIVPLKPAKTHDPFFSDQRHRWFSLLLSVTLVASLLTVGSTTFGAAPAHAQAKCDKLEDANAIWRCKYTDGKDYAPYRGIGGAPSEKGTKKFTQYGTQYTVYKGITLKVRKFQSSRFDPEFLTPRPDGSFATLPNGCAVNLPLRGVIRCRGWEERTVTTFLSRAETQKLIRSRDSSVDSVKGWLAAGVGSGIAIASLKWKATKGIAIYTTAAGIVSAVTFQGAGEMWKYLVANKNTDQFSRGLCYYSIQDQTIKGVVTQPQGATGPFNWVRGEERKGETLVRSGWYGPEYNKACK